MGVLHAAILKSLPETNITAVYETNRFLVSACKAFLPKTITVYRDLRTMFAKESPEAAFVTSPIHTHVEMLLKLLNLSPRLNLFVEKPLARTYDEASQATSTVEKMNCVNMVGFQKRFSPIFRKAKSIIETGQLGDLLFFKAHAFSSDVLREGRTWRFQKGKGGELLDLGPHILDLLSWYFGDLIPEAAVKTRFYSREVDDYVHTLISARSGLKGYVDVSWSIRNYRLPEISIDIHGRDGRLTVTDDSLSVQRTEGKRQTWYRQSFAAPIPFLLADPEFTIEDQAFVSSVRSGTSTEPDFLAAAKVNAIIDSISSLCRDSTG